MRVGYPEQAPRKSNGVTSAGPAAFQGVMRLAWALLFLLPFASAGEYGKRAAALRSDDIRGHFVLAMWCEREGLDHRAQEHYRQALRVWPEFAEAHNNLAVLLHLQGDLAEAETHYREALRLRPDDPETHYNLGLVLRSKGDETAGEHFRIASELAPEATAFRSAIEPPC